MVGRGCWEPCGQKADRQMDDRRIELVRSVLWFLRYERKGAVRLEVEQLCRGATGNRGRGGGGALH